jgi:hypothetical protein
MSRTEFVMKIPRFAMWTSVLVIAMKTMRAAVQARVDEQRRLALEGLRETMRELNGDKPVS